MMEAINLEPIKLQDGHGDLDSLTEQEIEEISLLQKRKGFLFASL